MLYEMEESARTICKPYTQGMFGRRRTEYSANSKKSISIEKTVQFVLFTQQTTEMLVFPRYIFMFL